MKIINVDKLDEAQIMFINKGLNKVDKTLRLNNNLIANLDGISSL